jgi:GNAT superfamily N-acetyltransferase
MVRSAECNRLERAQQVQPHIGGMAAVLGATAFFVVGDTLREAGHPRSFRQKPTRQGEGHGSAMIELGVAECDRAGLPGYLEATSSRSVPLYERHGFRVVGEIRIGECPPIFPMLRAAKSPGALGLCDPHCNPSS